MGVLDAIKNVADGADAVYFINLRKGEIDEFSGYSVVNLADCHTYHRLYVFFAYKSFHPAYQQG